MRTGCSGECVPCCLFPGCVRTSLSQPIRVHDSPPGCPPLLKDSAPVTVSVSLLTCSCYLHLFVNSDCNIFKKALQLLLNNFALFYQVWIDTICVCFIFPAPEIQADCVSLLALLHRGVCETWRVFVLSKALQSPEESVRAAAVRAFPLLLHHLGNKHHGLIGTTLLYAHVCL